MWVPSMHREASACGPLICGTEASLTLYYIYYPSLPHCTGQSLRNAVLVALGFVSENLRHAVPCVSLRLTAQTSRNKLRSVADSKRGFSSIGRSARTGASMKVLVVGAGYSGIGAARTLVEETQDVQARWSVAGAKVQAPEELWLHGLN